MLRFASKPDLIFLLLINQAIEDAIGHIEFDDDPAEQQEALDSLMPHSAKLYDVAGVKTQLALLKAAIGKAELYQPTDYHWLLLYEVLDAYCADFNETPHGILFAGYGLERLEIDHLADVFFWDTDFLDAQIPMMSLDAREVMDISPETFGLTAGLKPHPEELELERCEDELAKDFGEDPCVMFVPGSKVYPSHSDEQAT